MGSHPKSKLRREYDAALCQRLNKAVGDSGMTVPELADAIKGSRSSLYKVLEYGVVPCAFTLAKLCRVLGLDANELLGVKGKERA